MQKWKNVYSWGSCIKNEKTREKIKQSDEVIYLFDVNSETEEDITTAKNLIKAQTQQAGSIYTVYYGAFAGATSPVSYAVINTSLPSILNPTEVGTVNNGYKSPSSKLFEFYSGY